MNEIIKVTSRILGGTAVQSINARELHGFLGVVSPFRHWITRRIDDYGFEDAKDFCTFLSESTGGRPARDYYISIGMAKELAMSYSYELQAKVFDKMTALEEAVAKNTPQFYVPQTRPRHVPEYYHYSCVTPS